MAAADDFFKRYEWVKLESAIDSFPMAQQNALELFFHIIKWGDDEELREKITTQAALILKSDDFSIFLLALVWLYLGDGDKCLEVTQSFSVEVPRWYKGWLLLELMARTGQHEKMIAYVRNYISATPIKEERDWIYLACLHSSIHKKSDVTKLSCVLPKKISETEIGLFLYSRVHGMPYKRSKILFLDRFNARMYAEQGNVELYYKSLLYYFDSGYYDGALVLDFFTFAISNPKWRLRLPDLVKRVIPLVPDSLKWRGTIFAYLLIGYWVCRKFTEVITTINVLKAYLTLENSVVTKYTQPFMNLLLRLSLQLPENVEMYKLRQNWKTLYVVGESHSLALSHLYFSFGQSVVRGQTCICMGVKMHHFNPTFPNLFFQNFADNISAIPDGEDVLITVGEIDSRFDEGIFVAAHKKNTPVASLARKTVKVFFKRLKKVLGNKFHSITIQGVPAPRSRKGMPEGDLLIEYCAMLKVINNCMCKRALENGWNFLDVYSATVSEDLLSNNRWHIDEIHLNPAFYEQTNKWLITP